MLNISPEECWNSNLRVLSEVHKNSRNAAEKLDSNNLLFGFKIKKILILGQAVEFLIRREELIESQTPLKERVLSIYGEPRIQSLVKVFNLTLKIPNPNDDSDKKIVSLEVLRLRAMIEPFVDQENKVTKLRTVTLSGTPTVYNVPRKSLKISGETYTTHIKKVNDEMISHPDLSLSFTKRPLEQDGLPRKKRSRG